MMQVGLCLFFPSWVPFDRREGNTGGNSGKTFFDPRSSAPSHGTRKGRENNPTILFCPFLLPVLPGSVFSGEPGRAERQYVKLSVLAEQYDCTCQYAPLPCQTGEVLPARCLCPQFTLAMGFCSTSLMGAVEGNGLFMDCFPDAEHSTLCSQKFCMCNYGWFAYWFPPE